MVMMAAAAGTSNCSFAPLFRRGASRRHAVFCSSERAPKARRQLLRGSSSTGTNHDEIEAVSQKRFPKKGKDGMVHFSPHGAKEEIRRSQAAAFKSPGLQKKDKKGSIYDLNDQQVHDVGNLQDAAFLNAVVKVYCTHTAPDYSLPWQKQRQYTSTGSAFMIGDGKLLTNAHCVEHYTQVKVKRRGDDTKFPAKVLARGFECDLALLSVDNEEFWKGVEPLRFGRLPCLQQISHSTSSVTSKVVQHDKETAARCTCDGCDRSTTDRGKSCTANLVDSWSNEEPVAIASILGFQIHNKAGQYQ